ncbi:MAG: hypothetical protein JO166_08850 [Deltaproteobacteria bacterium]|nr:hypothetical protein [Deltaproteobacteria bacterium]
MGAATGQIAHFGYPRHLVQHSSSRHCWPRIWARTGCRYNVTEDRAQCETGGCADRFDCGTAGPGGVSLAGSAPVTIAEFCLNCIPSAQPTLRLNYWDVSAVDGVNLSMNVEPTGTFSASHPPNVEDKFWCQFEPNSSPEVYSPNSVSGSDLRASCPTGFQLQSQQLGMYIVGQSPNNVVACFSNCGAEEYPVAPSSNCTDSTNSRCGAWRAYCCQASDYGGNSCKPMGNTPQPGVCTEGDHICITLANRSGVCPGKPCVSDSDCAPYSTCWNSNSGPGTCACSGYAVTTPCPPDICTNVDLPAAEPAFAKCSQTADLPDIPNSHCIGDDTVHMVLPRAYSWPNDPQTYDCDNTTFTVTVSPGGVPKSAPITAAGPIPLCSSLPSAYNYGYESSVPCSVPIKAGAVFAGALLNPTPRNPWSCDISAGGAVPPGEVLCSWHTLPTP